MEVPRDGIEMGSKQFSLGLNVFKKKKKKSMLHSFPLKLLTRLCLSILSERPKRGTDLDTRGSGISRLSARVEARG